MGWRGTLVVHISIMIHGEVPPPIPISPPPLYPSYTRFQARWYRELGAGTVWEGGGVEGGEGGGRVPSRSVSHAPKTVNTDNRMHPKYALRFLLYKFNLKYWTYFVQFYFKFGFKTVHPILYRYCFIRWYSIEYTQYCIVLSYRIVFYYSIFSSDDRFFISV